MALAEKVVIAMKIQQLCMAYVTVSPSVRSHTGMDDFNTIGMGLIQRWWWTELRNPHVTERERLPTDTYFCPNQVKGPLYSLISANHRVLF